ncbi:MAG TPA: glycosyltransferase [Terriglobales bacterium]
MSQLVGRLAQAIPGGVSLLQRGAGVRAGARAPIFMLHRVLPAGAPCYDPEMALDVEAFAALLAWLVERFEVVGLEQVPERLRTRQRRPVCVLTFDDGWRDNFEHAFPLLQRYGLPATVFLPAGFIGTGRHFWQERLFFALRRLRPQPGAAAALAAVGRGFPWCPLLPAGELDPGRLRTILLRRASSEAETFVAALEAVAGPGEGRAEPAFMDWGQVREMQAGGIVFGSHTVNHTLLRVEPPGAAAGELLQSRQVLERELGHPVTAVSYPWGGMSPFTRRQAAAAGYSLAVTTVPGLANAGSHPLELPRIPLSNACLGWPARRARFGPGTLNVHLMRARFARPQPRPVALSRDAVGSGERLRIGVLVDNPTRWADVPDGYLAGSELQLRHTLEALDPGFFDLEFYFLRMPAGGLPSKLPWPSFAAAPAAAGRAAAVMGLRRLLRERRPAMVQSMFMASTFLGVPAAWLAGVPGIVCARRNAGYWKRWHHRVGLRVINRMATAWQTNGAAIERMLAGAERVRPSAIEILPNWLDLARFQPAGPAARTAARTALGLPAAGLIVVCVANYNPVKNLECLISAAALVASRLAEVSFILVGEGPERGRLAAAVAAHGLGTCLTLAGSSTQIDRYLAAADVGVLASRSEGSSNAVLEYMAAGLPVVLSDIAANRELADEELFPVGDAAALAAALLRLADPEARARQGTRNRRRAEQYGGALYDERVQGHYLRVAQGARRTR